jgi:Tol biopolymer transport system component
MKRFVVLAMLALLAALASTSSCTCNKPAGEGEGEGASGGEGEGANAGEGEGANAGEGEGSTGNCIAHLSSIALAPTDSTVQLDGTTAAPIDFTATGTFDDNHTAALDVTKLTWTATRGDDGDPGSISAGHYLPNPALGGVVTITATDGCVSGSTTVTFVVTAQLGTPGGAGLADWSGTPVTTGTLPTVVYPSDQTRFPRNIFQTLFQWHSGNFTEFRLTFAGAGSTVTVFSTGTDPQCTQANGTPIAGAACFTADANAWSLIAGSNAGGTATWTVDALDRSTTPPTVRRAPSVTIGFSKRDVKGAVFYWSTTSAGIRRANIGDATPQDYIAGKPATIYDPEGQIQCVACHYVSRDGRKIAAEVQSQPPKPQPGQPPPPPGGGQSMWIMNVTNDPPPAPVVTQVDLTSGHGFAAFSPDNSEVVAAWNGNLWLVDATSGASQPNLDLAGGHGTCPDWSPDGSAIAYSNQSGDAPGNADIDFLPATGVDTFGTPVTFLAHPANESNLYPMFSPDSLWLAFSQGKGGHGDKTMQLFVANAKATTLPATPIDLTNANCVVNNTPNQCLFENSMATWAPPGDFYWIAFNSQRAYGLVSQAGTQQIWVAAIDPAALAAGNVDPSFPAFRLQFQGLTENNHRAFWTLDVRQEPPVDAGPEDAGTIDAGNPEQIDAGPADAGPQQCKAPGNTCDPVLDCCTSGFLCDSLDNGVSYSCIPLGG